MKSGRYQRKAKGQCSKGDACSFRYDDSKRGKKTQSSSPAPRPQTQDDGKTFEREVFQRQQSFWKEKRKSVQSWRKVYESVMWLLRKFCLRCDTIDDSGVPTQRHDDEDKCAKWFETWDGTWDVDRQCSWEVRTTMNNEETTENKACMCIDLYSWQAHHSVYTKLDQLACFTQAHPRNALIPSK